MDWIDIPSIIIVAVIIFLLYAIYKEAYGQYGKSNLVVYTGDDGIKYYVHSGHAETPAETRAAVRALMGVQERNIELLDFLKRNYSRDIRTQRMLTNYNPDVIMENSPLNSSGDTAYILGKGSEFRMCIRSVYGFNPIHSDEILTFVHLHEMAHIASVSYDHDREFWSNFKWLLRRAEEAGIYVPVDYSIHPFEYCSVWVDYNPYYDKRYGSGDDPLYS